MFTARATFQQVEHVTRNAATRFSPECTVFSFMSDFVYHPYVTVPGRPQISPGVRVVALLRRQDDWKTLVGWRDLETGALASPSVRWHLLRTAFMLVWVAVGLFGLFKSFSSASPPAQFLVGCVTLFWIVFAVIEARALQQARVESQALLALPRE